MAWKRSEKIGLVALVLLSPVGLFLLCFMNPMVVMFQVPVNIANHTKSEVRAIPMGRGERDEVRDPPLSWRWFRVIPRPCTEFIVPAGASTSFIYDFDDVNLCWLLVRSESSGWKVVPSSLHGPSCALTPRTSGGCCTGVEPDFTFQVDDLESLPDAPAWLIAEACTDAGVP